MVGAVSAAGVLCHHTLDGGVHGATFLAFVTDVLVPALRPGRVMVVDNLSSHKTRAVRAAFATASVGVLYLPRYSPEWNPIELCWSKVKAHLRGVAARTRERLRGASPRRCCGCVSWRCGRGSGTAATGLQDRERCTSRRWPRATAPSGEFHVPSPSGPLDSIRAVARSTKPSGSGRAFPYE
ncbi:transposase [Rubrivirga sp.]|uniref:transposase n=1 Tax=Rubrivirga sp. TaxID=1885344 RepID=UPI003B5174CE